MATVMRERGGMGAGWGWMLASGLVALLLGVSALIWPFPATYALTVIVGALFLIAGALALTAGLAGRGHGRRGYLIGYGLLSLALGVLAFAWPLSTALSITMLVAAWLLARGVIEIATGLRTTTHRGLMIGLGVVNVLLALLIAFAPIASAVALPGYLLGISFLLGGAAETSAALHHRRGAPAFTLG